MSSRKPNRVKAKVTSDSKILAAKILVEKTKGVKALSHQEKRVAASLLAGVSDGDGAGIPRDEASEIAGRPHVRDVLVEALVSIGVTPQKLAKVLADGLDAESSLVIKSGGEEFEVKRPAHLVRHKFLETALSVVGVKGEKGASAPPPSNVFVFRSFLGENPVDVKVGEPTDAIVSRRLKAAKVRNRSNA